VAAETETVGKVLRRQAASRGTHPLLICDADRISYSDADHRSAELARALMALGAGKGSHVGLLYPNGTQWVIAMLAAARIGAVVVPFSTLATTSEMTTQLAHADIEILLATASYRNHDYRERLAAVEQSAVPLLRRVLIDADRLDMADDALLEAMEDDVDPSDPVAIVYTSGSTAAPKGVVHTHSSLLEHQMVLNEIRGLAADDRLFCNSPFFWIGGIAFAVLANLLAGATLICSNAADPSETLDLLEVEKPTVTNGFVAGIGHLARDRSLPRRDLSSIRRGNLYPIMAPDVRPADPELRHTMLGMTEAGSVITISADESDQPEHRRGSFGRPVPGFETKVDDNGELCIRGPFMMQRYYKRSREECFDADGWFRTGDLVRVDRDGLVYFVGRLGSMIKTAGANVAPAEVERAMAKATGLTAYVIGIPDAERGQQVAAVIATEGDIDLKALRHELARELSAYKIPRRIVVVAPARIPVLSSGKVDMKKLATVFDD
jgi:acyl-CoA synthetase (AMP-forming)/AMP-acid ligase II